MRLFLKSLFIVHCSLFIGLVNAAPTSRAKTTSVIGASTNVRAKVEAKGIYSQDCYDIYFGCMDQFCRSDNENGGSCTCSDDNAKYEAEWAEIDKTLDKAENLREIEVEKIKAGSKADIVFTGGREYDKSGNVVADGKSARKSKTDLLAMWNTGVNSDDDPFAEAGLENLVGAALYKETRELCLEQMEDSCSKDIPILTNLYQNDIKNSCKGFENAIAKKKKEADADLLAAEKEVRQARMDSFDEANSLDRGQCMLEFRKCMNGDDVCGKDWGKCAGSVASENMQNKKATSTANSKVEHISQFNITDSTMEIMDSKRMICENVLNKCMAVRDMVWPDFLREIAPDLHLAELNLESRQRQSCLTDISACIQKACKDDIAGKGEATMDACLSRPDMARSFCKVQIDACERMEPLIWGYVTDKLAAMRVDACTEEVKACYTSEDRCGENFENCIGMDYKFLHDMCPVDKLVVCKANKKGFKMEDIDAMMMGFYLNADNSALDQCQNLITTKMQEVCGSTTDCNKLAADDIIGTSSLKMQKAGDLYRITGMISFGSIKIGDGQAIKDDKKKLDVGQIGVEDYIAEVRAKNADVPDKDGIIAGIEEELENIAGTINRTIAMIEADQNIQYCTKGRDLSQINGKGGRDSRGGSSNVTTARFPRLLDTTKQVIAVAALAKAQQNYNKKLSEEITKATKDASADIAQYMCQKMAETGIAGGDNGGAIISTPLNPPYSISYDIGTGLRSDQLLGGGHGTSQSGGMKFKNSGYLGGGNLEGGGVSRETWAVFNREGRTCHFCTSTTATNCKTTGSSSWFHNSRKAECTTSQPVEKCEDIPM